MAHRGGHDFPALLQDYPVDLVLNLHQAALENQKLELKAQVLGFSVAVINALDGALGGGKGRILEHWLQGLEASAPEPGAGRPLPARKLNPEALAFFQGLPNKGV